MNLINKEMSLDKMTYLSALLLDEVESVLNDNVVRDTRRFFNASRGNFTVRELLELFFISFCKFGLRSVRVAKYKQVIVDAMHVVASKDSNFDVNLALRCMAGL